MRSPAKPQAVVKGAAVLTESRRRGRHQQAPLLRTPVRRRRARLLAALGLVGVLTAAVSAFLVHGHASAQLPTQTYRPMPLPTTPDSYFGLYAQGVPASYAGVKSFSKATTVEPKVVGYYSGWFEPFWLSFARAAAKQGSVPLVQIDPTDISLAAISSGRYDSYLTAYAKAVRQYHHPVILSFGHEMNGWWYSWGYRHTSPRVFVAAWRHIVTVFRVHGVRNVTWLWTINTITTGRRKIPKPDAWWPGSSYVTWVGIDGYYHKRSIGFPALFGPTISAVRELTPAPILIAETGAAAAAGQPAKIASLFAGVRAYRLLGFVWFDDVAYRDYRIQGAASIDAIRRGAKSYRFHVTH